MSIQVTTTFNFDEYKITQYKGIVRGIIVRSPTIIQGILGSLKNVIGGKIGAFSTMCEQTRQDAFDQLLEHTTDLGANAVVGFRYDSSDLQKSATEVLCYGTAVIIEKI